MKQYAILHIDGDAFFVACEVAKNPALKGKPVVTGQERRIASAMSYEAKALGVTRGMPIYEIRRLFPEVIVVSSDYRSYEIYSDRMKAILERFSFAVQKYSIDECFADLSHCSREFGPFCDKNISHYQNFLEKIQNTLDDELAISFALGLSINKVLAKVASKWKKPHGITIITAESAPNFLADLPIGKIWGIGPQTSALLNRLGIKTAGDFVGRDERWVRDSLAKPYYEIWQELSAKTSYPLSSEAFDPRKSLASTETFSPVTSSREFLFGELSRHVEEVCERARFQGLVGRRVSFFLKTRDFAYRRRQINLPYPGASPGLILSQIRPVFDLLYDPTFKYRATGVTLISLSPAWAVPADLFGASKRVENINWVYRHIDLLAQKFGRGAVSLASSLQKLSSSAGSPAADHKKIRPQSELKKGRKRFEIPMLGKVK